MDESEQALRERIRSFAEDVSLESPSLAPVLARARARKWSAGAIVVAVTLGVAATLFLSLRSLLPLGANGQGSTPAGEGAGTYLLSNPEVRHPYVGPDGSEDPSRAGVLFDATWSGPIFPGEAPCAVHVFDAAGNELGSLHFGLEIMEPPRSVEVGVPIDGGVPASASGTCGPGTRPTGDYVFSNLRVVDSRLVGDIAWGSDRPPGSASCRASFEMPDGTIRTSEFTLSAPEGTDAFITRAPEPDATPLGVDCQPYTVPVADDQAPQAQEDLWGHTFVSVAVTEDGEARPLVPDTRIEATFEEREDEGVVRWQAGCNIQGSTVEATPERLLVGDEIAGTDVGCSDELHEQDGWLRGFFSSDPNWELHGDRLTLSSGETVIELEADSG